MLFNKRHFRRPALIGFLTLSLFVPLVGPAEGAEAPGPLDPRLATIGPRFNFKIMLSYFQNGRVRQFSSGRLDITVNGAAYGTFQVTAGGRLNFHMPTASTSIWTLTLPGTYARHFIGRVQNGILRVHNDDRDARQVSYFVNEDGGFALEYYQDRLYICNQGQAGGPILGRLKRGQILPGVRLAQFGGDPAGGNQGGGQEDPNPGLPPARPPGGPEDDFGGVFSPDDIVAGVVNNVQDLPASAVISAEFNAARSGGATYLDNRVLPYSWASSINQSAAAISGQTAQVPGLVFQWVYAGNTATRWQLAMPGTRNATQLLWRTLLGRNETNATLLVLLRRFSAQFLRGLRPGRNVLRYWLEDAQGRRSNVRREVVTIR